MNRSYLEELQSLLRRGAALLPSSFRDRQRGYLLSRLDVSGCGGGGGGGFAGPDGAADLYYTRFALQALDMLGGLEDAELRQTAGEYLARQDEPRSVVDWLCWLHGVALLEGYGEVPQKLCLVQENRYVEAAEFIGACRSAGRNNNAPTNKFVGGTRSGCYSDSPGGPEGAYFSMLAIIALELLPGAAATAGADADQRTVECLLSCRTADGGFAESASGGESAQANPTAAALVALDRLGHDDADTVGKAGAALAALQDASGGVLAHAAAPVADLMSTFTVLEALRVTGQLRRLRLGGAGRFVSSLALGSGGFCGVPGAAGADVEYTFYGLGALSLLSLAAAERRKGTDGRS